MYYNVHFLFYVASKLIAAALLLLANLNCYYLSLSLSRTPLSS